MVYDARGLGELANPSARLSIVVTVRSYNICTDKVERNGSHLW